jgi:AcrR family transcriptional regulator
MGVKERRDRTHRAITRAILDAARELFVSQGYRHVTIRKIAERIEYSPAAIYRYFSSKDDIFFALAEEGFRLLADRAAPHMAAPDPLVAVRQVFWDYYEFSKAHPEYFALMFLDRSVPRISRDWERFAFVHEMKGALGARLRECIAAGQLPATLDAGAAFSVLAAAVHGAAVIRLCGRLASGEDADALARAVLDAVLAGLRAGTPVALVAPSRCPAVAAADAPASEVTDPRLAAGAPVRPAASIREAPADAGGDGGAEGAAGSASARSRSIDCSEEHS